MAMASKAYEGGRVKELTGRCLDLGTNGQDKRGQEPAGCAAVPSSMALRQWCQHGGRALRRRRLPAQTRSLNRNGAETDGSAATTSAGTGGVRGGRFVFLGAPGVGKGTFAAIIAPQMGLRVVSTGDLIRAALLKGQQQQQHTGAPPSPAALPALSASDQETVRGGGLLPDPTVLALVQAALLPEPLQHQPAAAAGGGGAPGAGGGGVDAAAGFILDGFPRTVAQALALESMLSSSGGHGSGLTGVVSIELAEWVAVAKVLGRRLCSLCGRGFNTADVTTHGFDMPAIPPPPPGQCSGKGGPGLPCPVHSPGGLVRREDDTEEVVRRRLQVHRDSTAPLLRFYEARGLLVRFQVKKGVKDAPQLRHIMTNMLLQQQQQQEAAAVAGGGPGRPHGP